MIKTGKLRLRRWTLTFLKGQAAFAIEQMNDNKAGLKLSIGFRSSLLKVKNNRYKRITYGVTGFKIFSAGESN